MQLLSLLVTVKENKKLLNKTIQDISRESGVSVRTINRFFAGDNIGYKHVEAILTSLNLHLTLNKEEVD